MTVEASTLDSPLAKARDMLRRGENAAATKALASLLVDRPNQPLLNFLYAYSIGLDGELDASRAGSQRDALRRLAESGPRDLLRMVTPSSFSSIGAGPLRAIFLAVPEERRTDHLWERISELAGELNRFDLSIAELDRAIALTTEDRVRARRQISRVELLLKNAHPQEAADAAKALTADDVSPTELVELGDIFGRADMSDFSNFFFEKARRALKLTPAEEFEFAYHQALWQKKGESRWRLLILADAKRNDLQHALIQQILLEANDSRDAEILGRLVSGLKPGIIQTQLMLKQAELTNNQQQAADIVLKLLAEKRVPESKLEWGLFILERDQRAKEIIDLLERRLRKGRKVENDWLSYLANAYKALNRDVDYRRAISQFSEQLPQQKAGMRR